MFRWFLFNIVSYVSAFVFCCYRGTHAVALSHNDKQMEHSSAKVQSLACSVCKILHKGSQRTGWNRFFNPSFGGFRSISSGKLFTTYFAKTSWDRALRFAEHWMSHLSDQQHRRKVSHLDLRSKILHSMMKLHLGSWHNQARSCCLGVLVFRSS